MAMLPGKLKTKIQAETMIVSVVVISLLLYYFLVYIPNKTEEVNATRFRYIRQTIENIDFRISNYKSLLNNYAGIYYKSASQSNSNYNSGKKNNNVENVDKRILQKNNDTFRVERVKAPSGNQDSINAIPALENGTLAILSDSMVTSKNNAYLFKAYIDTDIFFRKILRSKVFDAFLVYDVGKNQLLYESQTTGLSFSGLDTLLRNKSAVTQPVITEINNGGNKSVLFMHTTGGTHGYNWVVAGVINNKAYRAECQSIGPHVMFLLIFSILLILLLLPLLKFVLIGKNEQIRLGDATRTGVVAFLIVGVVIFILFSENPLIREENIFKAEISNADKQQIADESTGDSTGTEKSNVTDYADHIARSINNEVDYVCSAAIKIDELVQKNIKPSSGSMYAYDTYKDVEDVSISSVLSTLQNKNSDLIIRIFWLDSAGQELMQISNNKQPMLFGNYQARGYFKKVLNDSLQDYAYGTNKKCRMVIEPVYSWESDPFNLVMAMPSVNKNWAAAVAVSFNFQTPKDQLLPIGWQMGIIDNEGKIIQHTDQSFNLNENLTYYDDDDGSLSKALYAGNSTVFSTNFEGKPLRIYTKPIPNNRFHLVFFEDLSYKEIRDTQVFIHTWILIAGLALFLISELIIILSTHFRSKNQLKNHKYELSWLYPRRPQYGKYNLIIRVHLFLILLLTYFSTKYPFPDQLLVFGCAMLLSTYFMDVVQVHRKNKQQRYEMYLNYTGSKLRKTYLALIGVIILLSYSFNCSTETYISIPLLFVVLSFIGFTIIYEYQSFARGMGKKFPAWALWLLLLIIGIILFKTIWESANEYRLLWNSIFVVIGLSFLNSIRMKGVTAEQKREDGYMNAFTLMLTTRLILLGVIPVASFYINSYEHEQDLFMRLRLHSLATTLEEKDVANTDEFRKQILTGRLTTSINFLESFRLNNDSIRVTYISKRPVEGKYDTTEWSRIYNHGESGIISDKQESSENKFWNKLERAGIGESEAQNAMNAFNIRPQGNIRIKYRKYEDGAVKLFYTPTYERLDEQQAGDSTLLKGKEFVLVGP